MASYSKREKSLIFVFSLLLVYVVEWTASYFTQRSVGSWYLTLEKPFWTPPNLTFPIAWTLLYTLIGISLALVICSRPLHKRKLYVSYGLQLFLNFLWSFSFFYLESAFLGLVNIVLLLFAIVWNIYEFKRCSKWAAWLLYPYFLWVLYASTLNFAIWCLN
jgi:benzodiazapine receptor